MKNATSGTVDSKGKLSGTVTGNIAAAGKECIKVSLTDYNAATNKPAFLKVENGADATASICEKVLKTPSIVKVMKGKFGYSALKTAATSSKDAVYEDAESGEGEVAISGVGVVF